MIFHLCIVVGQVLGVQPVGLFELLTHLGLLGFVLKLDLVQGGVQFVYALREGVHTLFVTLFQGIVTGTAIVVKLAEFAVFGRVFVGDLLFEVLDFIFPLFFLFLTLLLILLQMLLLLIPNLIELLRPLHQYPQLLLY